MVKERKAQYKDLHEKRKIAGTCLCITALIPLFAGVIIDADNDLFLTIMLSLSFLIADLGVLCFIKTGIIWLSYEKLLQEGEYSKENKETPSIASTVYIVYWIITTAIYLGYSLTSGNWMQSWVIWVVAVVMFPAIVAITHAFDKKTKKPLNRKKHPNRYDPKNRGIILLNQLPFDEKTKDVKKFYLRNIVSFLQPSLSVSRFPLHTI